MKTHALVVIGLFLLLVSACGAAASVDEDTPTQGEAPAAVLTLQRSAPLPPDGDFHNDAAELVGNTGKPQFVEFFTFWCPTCRTMKPLVHSLEAEYWGQIDFVYLDREDAANRELVAQFGVRGQPVLFLLDAQGNIINQWFGIVNADELQSAFAQVLGES